MIEFTLREWLIVLGVLLIVGVLLDGYRRVRRNRSNTLKLAIDKNLKFREDTTFNGELPSGGARIARPAPKPVEPVEPEQEETLDSRSEPEGGELVPDPLFADDAEIAEYAQAEKRAKSSDPKDKERNIQAHENEQKSGETESVPDENPAGNAEQTGKKAHGKAEEVIAINVLAKNDGEFKGDDLMRLVLACGMRFGDMDIFHRHEQDTGKGPVQFSMANAVNPGHFNLDDMGGISTPGVIFFMSLPGPKDSMKAFDYMLETANCVVKNLDGELKDEQQSVMTKQTVEHTRQRIRDFERHQLSLTLKS